MTLTKDVKVECDIPKHLWLIEADMGQLSQVVQNLVINSCQAMPAGGIITIGADNINLAENSVMSLPSGRYVRITIRDNGEGIPGEIVHRIFDPYFTTKQRGNGLGLAVAYSVIKKHGGHIAVESKLGEGTVFIILLPASADQPVEGEKIDGKNKLKKEAGVLGQGKILIMDDEPMIRNTAFEMLRHSGYEVSTAADGEEALELYNKAMKSGTPFDAVILDITVVGGMGGQETMKRLLKLDPGVVAIVSSGYASDPLMAEYRSYGFKAAVPKPYYMETLLSALEVVLKQGRYPGGAILG